MTKNSSGRVSKAKRAKGIFELIELFKLFTLLTLFTLVFIGCAPTFKAQIDTYGSRKILWPGPPEKPRIRYLWSISLVGEGPGNISDLFFGKEDVLDPVNARSFRTPAAIYKKDENLYVADPGAYRVSIINIKTFDVIHIYRLGDDERLAYPVSVVTDREGNIYISDSGRRKIFVFNQKGDYIESLNIDFGRPAGMAFWEGFLFVADSLKHRIYRLNTQEGDIIEFGKNGIGDGEFNYPTFITVKSGMLYVIDSMNNRVQVFDTNGKFITKFGSIGNTYADLEKPKGIAVDSMGNIYAVDAIQDMVKIFDSSGRLLLFFGEKGHGYGEFWLPSGIFIDKDDKIYVADSYNSRIQVFELIKEETKVR